MSEQTNQLKEEIEMRAQLIQNNKNNFHQEDLQNEPNSQKNIETSQPAVKVKTSPWFWFFSVSASLVFAAGNILRAFHSNNVLLNTLVVNIAFFIGSVSYFLVAYIKAHINQGICTAIIATNTIIMTIASYFLFKESIQLVQLLGVIAMVVAVFFVSIFRVDQPHEQGQINSHSHISTDQEDDGTMMNIVFMIIGGLAASIMFGSQLLFFRKITQYNTETFGIGFAFLLYSSFWAILTFIYMIIADPDQFLEVDFTQYSTCFVTGILLTIAIVFINVSCSYGLIGISTAILHNQVIVVTIFNYLFFSQDLSLGQAVGVGLCVIGAILISNGDRMTCFNKKK
ncbi:UNKNOWN [Stylonychia lemnae]|uniref:EamA domain-containing protein n=1 Tax=Stylonychia lemnae TaxID=5949 RepID=A0A077ZT34_STYLE|nr:UNKNOWN [Stylonychia lemnae]|eukprot:CDW73047.1 UNKNOWN [Stylonychia lemnae]